jgi:hypothetical protein
MKEHREDTVEGSIRLLEKELGIREGFLESLKNEDDWSFIIKIHALLEGAISHLLCKALGHDGLSEVFSFIELSNKRSGKMAFVKTLSLLDKPDRRFISSLSELRNSLVHDISNVDFNLKKYIENLAPDKFKTFVKSMDSFSYEGWRFKGGAKELTVEEFFKADPKKAIWYSAMLTTAIIYQQQQMATTKKRIEVYKEFFGWSGDVDKNQI